MVDHSIAPAEDYRRVVIVASATFALSDESFNTRFVMPQFLRAGFVWFCSENTASLEISTTGAIE